MLVTCRTYIRPRCHPWTGTAAMTLHLTLATAEYVLQVSDRLTSLDPGKRPWDPLANKNVIYVARNGLISIGYTGAAYIGVLPTDTWIAQTLRGDASPLRMADTPASSVIRLTRLTSAKR
jgi:hypothetical protein